MTKKVFEGIKIAEFAWAVVGPVTSRYFADHGATVVRIETHKRLDILRGTTPFANRKPDIDGSVYYGRHNSNKLSVSIDLGHPNSKSLAMKLIMWADIVTESFSPGIMKKWSLDYESVKKIKPDVIYLSSSMQGRGGPHESYTGLGMNAVNLCGFGMVTGWPDRDPAPPYGAYTDYISPRFNAAALIAALDFRRRTGKGQWIEQSQFETSLHFFSPPIMDYQINGRVMNSNGNRLDSAAPHGVYQCKGDDRWMAIAIFTEKEWQTFCILIGSPEWCASEKFSTKSGRKKNEDELDRLITSWTLEHTAEEIDKLLQDAGIACNIVEKSSDVYQDPQLAYRKRFPRLDHPVMGNQAFETQPCFILSKEPREITRPSPCLGEHNQYVFKELLGMSDAEIAEHIEDGSITTKIQGGFKANM